MLCISDDFQWNCHDLTVKLQPDIVCPGSSLNSAYSDGDLSTKNCGTVRKSGTSVSDRFLKCSFCHVLGIPASYSALFLHYFTSILTALRALALDVSYLFAWV